MGVFKVDLIFDAKGRGWDETYYKDFGSTPMANIYETVRKLALKRYLLSAQPVTIKGFRVSDPLTEGVQGMVTYFKPEFECPQIQEAQNVTSGAVSPAAALNIGFYSTAVNRARRISMRGVWDGVITYYNGLASPNFSQWYSYFEKWRTFVIAEQYGWLVATRASEGQCTYAYSGTDQFPTFTFAANFFDAAEVGKYRTVRFSKFNNSKSVLNRELVVFVTSQLACTSATAISAGPMTNAGKCIRYTDPTFVTATTINVQRVGRRAPGKAKLVTPGRSSARPRT